MKHYRRSIHRWAFALALAFFAIEFGLTSLLAQGGAIVRSIDVQYAGPKTVSREKILSQMRTTVGQPYSDDVVEQDIRNLYKTGAAAKRPDLWRTFRGRRQGYRGCANAFDHAPRLRSTARIVSARRRVRSEIKIKMNTPVSEDALTEARQKIIDLYRRFGYNDVGVEYRVERLMKRTALRARFSRSTKARRARSVVFVSKEITLSAIARCAKDEDQGQDVDLVFGQVRSPR